MLPARLSVRQLSVRQLNSAAPQHIILLTMRRIFLHSALALLLLITQQLAFAHLLTHASQHSAQHDPGHERAKACAKCLAAAHLGDAVSGTAPALNARWSPPPVSAMAPLVQRRVLIHAYRSRAPPSSL